MSPILEKRGGYSARVVLQARGGLIAQYYRTPGFQSMVVQGADRQHPGDSPVEFTQVDPVLNLEWPGSPALSCPEDYWSVVWYGYMLPKAPPSRCGLRRRCNCDSSAQNLQQSCEKLRM